MDRPEALVIPGNGEEATLGPIAKVHSDHRVHTLPLSQTNEVQGCGSVVHVAEQGVGEACSGVVVEHFGGGEDGVAEGEVGVHEVGL